MLKYYNHPRFLVLVLFGFLSALPLPLAGSALTAWLAEEHIPKILIGVLAFFECPFAIKPLFWPLINRVSIPYLTPLLGRRRSWTLVSFLGLALFLALAAITTPVPNLYLFYTLIGCISAFSGCVYLIGIAYEIESLDPLQYGQGSACVIFGYRLGLLTAGAGTLFMAHYYSWTTAYLAICLIMTVGAICLLFADEPRYTPAPPVLPEHLKNTPLLKKLWAIVYEDVIGPAFDLIKRPEWQWILFFLLFYRAGDYLVDGMINPFYLSIGFNKAEIAYVAKITGMVATISGALLGGVVFAAIGLKRALVLLSVVHAGRFLLYLEMINVGPNISFFMFTEAFQHFSGGMMMTVFIAALWKLTTPGKAAPQYAMLWSALSIKSKCLAFCGGVIAHYFSWDLFFTIALIMGLGGSLLPLGVTILQDIRGPGLGTVQE